MTTLLEEVRERLAADYRVEEEIGRGGMAVVFRAVDLRHGRSVAVKVMHPALTPALGGERFLREIQLAARLAHPRIVAVYASGNAEGLLYYVMPFVDGPTLRARLDREPPVGVREAVGITRDVARALAYAHASGVVHRDIKPENIMLPGGEAVVTDFGVARLVGEDDQTRLTLSGMTIGTPAYMSPEQASGGDTHWADVYSLGCVLYEMLTGRPPFVGPTALATLVQHSTQAVPPIHRTDLTPAILEITQRCLAKEPAERPTALELEDALREAIEEPGAGTRISGGGAAPPAVRILALLPFSDISPDQSFSYLCEGVAQELLDALSRVPLLRVIARASSHPAADSGVDLREKARRLGAQTVLEGSVRVAGERIRVGVQLTQIRDATQLWSQRFEGSLGDVFAIEDQIARAVVAALQAEPGLTPATPTGPPTENMEAHRHYLLGRRAWQRRTPEALAESVDWFREAVHLDPGFALAHVGLAEARILQAVYGVAEPALAMPAARDAANRALALRPGMGEALSARASVAALYDWDWEGAELDFVAAVERHPGYSTARQWYAMHLLVPRARFADARAELERARLADPLSPAILASLGQVAHFAGSAGEAVRLQQGALALEPDFAAAHLFLGQAELERGHLEEAIEALTRAVELTGGSSEGLAFQALAYGRAGQEEDAAALVETLRTRVREGGASPVLLAIGLVGIDELGPALEALEAAEERRATDLVWLRVRPAFAALHGEPRYQALLRRMHLA